MDSKSDVTIVSIKNKKRKQNYRIHGLNLLHLHTQSSQSLESLKPAKGCIDEALFDRSVSQKDHDNHNAMSTQTAYDFEPAPTSKPQSETVSEQNETSAMKKLNTTQKCKNNVPLSPSARAMQLSSMGRILEIKEWKENIDKM